jgi:dTMP kinase
MSSKFIIVEGPDFCGKSTQLKLLDINTWYFNKRMFFTREPGSHLPESSEICEKIREQILHNDNTLEDEAVLFAQSRYEHTKEIVKLLTEDDNTVVISDRYIVSSLAYQGYAQYLGKDMIYELNEPSLRLLRDNDIEIHCIKFTIDEEEWRKRRDERLENEEADSIEQKSIHEDILYFFSDEIIFNKYTKDLNMKVYNVDANGPIMQVYLNLLETVREILEYN